MPYEPDLSKLLRHRLAMMAITLDGAESPPRARLLWSLVNHGGQPVDPDGDAFTTGVRPVDVITLVAIADVYGVPRGYLTAPGSDTRREEMIDEDFFRIRTTTDTPRPLAVAQPRPNAPATLLSNYGVALFLLLLIVLFAALAPNTFSTWDNARAVLADYPIPGLLTLAAILPLTVGEFDLSLGATLGFSAIVSVSLLEGGLPLPIVIITAVAIGVAAGLVNSLLVIRLKINAFIATLGVATLLAGGNLLLTNGSLLTLSSSAFADLTITRFGEIQLVLGYFIAASLILWFVMEKTPFGRYARATGLGRSAATLSAIPTSRMMTVSLVAASVLAATAGVLYASRAGSTPPSLGPEFLLPAYAAAFLGATTIRPGFFNVWRTVVCVFLLAVGSNGLTLLGAQTWVTNVSNGGALILSVAVAGILTRRRKARQIG